MHLDILHRDPDFVAVYKPAGLLVHRTFLDAHETRFCVQLLRDQLGCEVFPCHRLDKPTSGILLFALHPSALQQAQEAFTSGAVTKRYLAIVRGWTPPAGVIDYPLRYEADTYDSRTGGRIQEATTAFQCLATTEFPAAVGRYPTARYSLISLHPSTGRKHQLRRHLAHLRHPIVGDTRHGDGVQNRFFRQQLDCHRLLLTATDLAFPPESALRHIQIQARPDPDFMTAAEQVGLRPLSLPEVTHPALRPEGA
jgi:tRNA pseudouridine65 synthase